jgi:hypothetical protein
MAQMLVLLQPETWWKAMCPLLACADRYAALDNQVHANHTKNLSFCIYVLLQPERWKAMGPLLACADTNAAVDNLVEGLADKGLKVVRLGNPAKVRALSRYIFKKVCCWGA